MIGSKRVIAIKRVIVTASLLASVTLSSAGCRSTSKLPSDSMTSPADVPNFAEYFDVVHVLVEGERRRNRRAGQVYRKVQGANEVLWVRDLRLREVGFILKGIAFRVEERVLPDGSSEFEQTEMGDYGVEGGVQRLLKLDGGSVRLEKVTARAEAR